MTPFNIPEPDWTLVMSDPVQQAAAAGYWRVAIADMSVAGTLSASNVAQLKRYVVTLVLYDIQAAALFDEGTVRTSNKKTGQKVINPRWLMYKDTNTITTALEEALGLTPRRRGQVTKAANTAKPKANPAEAFLKVA